MGNGGKDPRIRNRDARLHCLREQPRHFASVLLQNFNCLKKETRYLELYTQNIRQVLQSKK